MRLFFSSYHNYLDLASGAAISVREVLLELVQRGWNVRVFCGAFFDGTFVNENTFLTLLIRHKIKWTVERFQADVDGKKVGFRLYRFEDSGIHTTVFIPDDSFVNNRSRILLRRTSGDLFLKLFIGIVDSFKPDVYLTYGGYWASIPAAKVAKKSGAKNVFYLCNFAYNRLDWFNDFDSVIVPSEFARAYYREKLRLDTTVLPPLLDERKFLIKSNSRQFVTFVNPSPEKGVFFFIGIARALNRICPEIPLLVVESRGRIENISSIDEARTIRNLHVFSNTIDVNSFYQQTRILLVPSVWNESFGRVAVEAALNGIPIICSNRGALPEVIAGSDKLAEFILDIPKKFTPRSTFVPSEEEVKPWVDMIVKLWKDEAFAQNVGKCALEVAERYLFRNVATETENLFLHLLSSNTDR